MKKYFRTLYQLDDEFIYDEELIAELQNAHPELSENEAREIFEEYLLGEEYENELADEWDDSFSTGGADRHHHEG